MKRPADRGKGYDGVVSRRAGYCNPATEILEGRAPMSTAPERQIVRPYGDTTGDGMVQVSFTLPVPHDKRAEGAALQLAAKMGMDPAMLVHAKAMGPDFTFFVVYGAVNHLVDLSAVQVLEREYPLLTAKEVNSAIKKPLRRKLVVVGACIGTDAHTVGIDAILNIKGFAGREGPRVLPGDQGREPRRPGARPGAGRAGRARRRPTRCSSPRSSPSATPT